MIIYRHLSTLATHEGQNTGPQGTPLLSTQPLVFSREAFLARWPVATEVAGPSGLYLRRQGFPSFIRLLANTMFSYVAPLPLNSSNSLSFSNLEKAQQCFPH